MVPADSAANQLHDHELACRLTGLADGSMDMDKGVAALLAQHTHMEIEPARPRSGSVFGAPASSGAASSFGDTPKFGGASLFGSSERSK